jgi:type III pantothenate kinase
MLLAVDIGNTSITFGVFQAKRLIKVFRLISAPQLYTYKRLLKQALADNKIRAKDISAIIICSVVPKLTFGISWLVKEVFGLPAVILGTHIKAPIKNNYKNPRQVGQDRLVDAVAAKEIYGVPVVIIDSGTAITFDYVNKKGEYEGGLIMPGIDISLKALYNKTALLPEVKLKHDKGLTLIGKDTVNSIKSGLLHGFGSMADGVIGRIKEKYGPSAKVIGTGGYIRLIKKYASSIDIIDEDLTLKGLRIICEKYLQR